jgi:hypothetical protein
VPLAALLLAGLAVAAEPNERGIKVTPDRTVTGVTLTLEMKVLARGIPKLFLAGDAVPELPVGSHVKICVTATATGYITLWSIDSRDEHVRIYPNDRAYQGRRGAPIQKDEPTCVGEGTDFQLQVEEPLGRSQVYAHWTPTEETQLAATTYPDLGHSLRSANPPGEYASQTLEYIITR